MGTRSLTIVRSGGVEILNFYRQMDGYPTGHGKELKDFLAGIEIVNGYSGEMKVGTHANGMGCLAAQLVAHLKNLHGLGGIYIKAPGARRLGEEYIYQLEHHGEKIFLILLSGRMTAFGFPGDAPEAMKTIYEGPIDEFDPEKVEASEREEE